MVKNKILLVEDDEDIIYWIISYFEVFGFDIKVVSTVTDALSNLNMNEYDLVLLDINLPDYVGYEVLKYIQENKINISVIVISAYDDRKNKLHAFKLGASDYMTKPLDMEELEYRIRVHINRCTKDQDEPNRKFKVENNIITYEDKQFKLTKIEFQVLNELIKNKNKIMDRETLCQSISSVSSSRSLDFHIKNIRKKMKEIGVDQNKLITEYGVGYKLLID